MSSPRTPATAPSCSDFCASEVVPLYYDRGADGLPHAWLETVRASLRSLGPQFSAQRMLRDYRERVYRD